MKVAVTGATGEVGHWIAAGFLEAGHAVTTLGLRPSRHARAVQLAYDLGGAPPELSGHDVLVHAAFSHVPGRYRGGEGDDATGFVRRNRDGTIRLFEAAREARVSRILFLSTRAVYGGYPPGTRLTEDLPPRPDTLYGRVKLEAEQALAALAGPGLAVASLRATGVFGDPVAGLRHKWRDLFEAFARGQTLPPRIGTEVYAPDLAAVATLLAETEADALELRIFNVSDLVVDRHDLLTSYAEIAGVTGQVPPRSNPGTVSAMTTDRLQSLGWRPAGDAAVRRVIGLLAEERRQS